MSPPCSLGKIHGNRNGKVIANMPLDNLASGLAHSSQLPLTPREWQVLQELWQAVGGGGLHVVAERVAKAKEHHRELLRERAAEGRRTLVCQPDHDGSVNLLRASWLVDLNKKGGVLGRPLLLHTLEKQARKSTCTL